MLNRNKASSTISNEIWLKSQISWMDISPFLYAVLVANLEFASFRKHKCTAYDRFHENVPYGKIATK